MSYDDDNPLRPLRDPDAWRFKYAKARKAGVLRKAVNIGMIVTLGAPPGTDEYTRDMIQSLAARVEEAVVDLLLEEVANRKDCP